MTTKQVESTSAEDEKLAVVREAIRTGKFENRKAYAPIAGELCAIGQLILKEHVALKSHEILLFRSVKYPY